MAGIRSMQEGYTLPGQQCGVVALDIGANALLAAAEFAERRVESNAMTVPLGVGEGPVSRCCASLPQWR